MGQYWTRSMRPFNPTESNLQDEAMPDQVCVESRLPGTADRLETNLISW